jgi:predicted transposase YdaD
MREPDVFFNIPMLDRKNENVALFAEQQHEQDDDLPKKIFDVYVRVREKWRQPTTCIAIYTSGESSNVNTYVETCFGCEVSIKFRTYYLPEKTANELRADDHPFARVMLAARLALDAGDNIKLREQYAEEIAGTTAENENKMFILDFAQRILQLNDDKISEHVKEVYRLQTIPLEEYRKRIRLQGAREEGREEGIEEGLDKAARLMLARGTSAQEVAETLGLPAERLQQLQPH